MSPKNTDELESRVDVVADFLSKQEAPFLIVVGIPGTEEYIVKDNLTDGENKIEVLNDFSEVTRQALTNHMKTPG